MSTGRDAQAAGTKGDVLPPGTQHVEPRESLEARSDARSAAPASTPTHSRDLPRLAFGVGLALLVLDTALTAALCRLIPETIAVHWTASGRADREDVRALVWLLPMFLGFIIALAAIGRRHVKPQEQSVLAGGVVLSSLYLLGASLHILLSNLGTSTWQEGSVHGGWMLLSLTWPGLIFAGGLYFLRARQRARER